MVNPSLVAAILEGYTLDPWHIHGVTHWARLMETAWRIVPLTGARPDVVELFCALHDARRLTEHQDPGHGARGGTLARELHGRLFDLDDAGLELLVAACRDHTDGLTVADVTIQTCWDCDRLDIGRVRIRVVPRLLCTEAARQAGIIAWADDRARRHFEPAGVLAAWGVRHR